MAYALDIRAVVRVTERMLNPCRYCGEKASIQSRDLSYAVAEEIRATCPAGCDPVYLSAILENFDIVQKWRMMKEGLIQLLAMWNDRHDGPAFFAGLA